MNDSHNDRHFLTRKGAAHYLNISLRFLDLLTELGDIPTYKFGRAVRIKREEIDAFVDSSRVDALSNDRHCS